MRGVNYETLGMAFKVISDACYEAARQQKEGLPVSACGMSDEDLEELCEQIPHLLNPMMSTEEVRTKLRVSEATLNRMVARGDIPNGEKRKHGHTRYWKKWDVIHYLKSKIKK